MAELSNLEQETILRQTKKNTAKRPKLPADINFRGQKSSYRIIHGDEGFIGSGSESDVYKTVDESTDKVYAGKIDMKFTERQNSNAQTEDNRNKVAAFLQQHTDYQKYHLLPLVDFGFFEETSNMLGTTTIFPVDIYPFCPEGSLVNNMREHSLEELRKIVIPSLVAAIGEMHEAKILHRDIKPDNLFKYNGEYVIGDFTSATAYSVDQGQMVVVKTGMAQGTKGYTAREATGRTAYPASDMFSIGYTIATLYLGKHPYFAFFAETAEFEALLQEHMDKDEVEMVYRSEEDRRVLKPLIDGLTKMNFRERATLDDIRLWLSDPDKYIEKYKQKYIKIDGWAAPIIFENRTCLNEAELASVMLANWTAAKKYLYDPALLITEKAWNGTQKKKIKDICEEPDTARNQDFGLAKYLDYLLNNGGAYFWCGKEYKSLPEIAADAAKTLNSNIIAMLKSGYLSWKIGVSLQNPNITSQMKISLQKELQDVQAIEGMSHKYPNLAYYYAVFQWGKGVKKSIKSPDDYFAQISGSPDTFYRESEKMNENDMVLAEFANLGFIEFVVKFKDSISIGNNNRDNLERFYDLFDSICTDKVAVRMHYLKYSPRAYLNWFKNNLSLYSFNTEAAKALKRNIEQITVTSNMTIDKIRAALNEVQNRILQFNNLFQSDFLMACLGLTKGLAQHGEITATHVDAFFLDTFFGENVPVGFRKSLLVKQNADISHIKKVKRTNGEQPMGGAGREQKQANTKTTSPTSYYYDVILTEYKAKKDKAASVICAITNTGSEDAMDMIENLPAPIARGISLELSKNLQRFLCTQGIGTKLSSTVRYDNAAEESIRRNLKENNAEYWIQQVGRNDPCPCGSELKFKHCCGKSLEANGIQRSGIGTEVKTICFQNGAVYTGTVKDGKAHGSGEINYTNGEKYQGEFVNGKYEGHGTYYYPAPRSAQYVGEFLKGEKHGAGEFTYKDGTKKKVNYLNGKLLG